MRRIQHLCRIFLFLKYDCNMNCFETDVISDDLKITFLHHASLLLQYMDKVIYVDPVGEFDDFRMDYSAMPKADLIFITHDHYDHFSPDVIGKISKDGTEVVANELAAKQLERAMVMHNGDTLEFMDGLLKVEAVPAYNITPGHTHFHTPARDNGYLFDFNGLTVYVAGDTEDVPEMELLGNKNVDVAFLPVNQPYTMTLEQAARMARLISPKILYPYHFTDTDIEKLPSMLAGSGIEVRLRKMN